MAKYESLADEPLWVDVDGRLTKVDPGAVIDIPEGTYVQTGDHGEPPMFKAITPAAKKPTTTNAKDEA